MANTDAFDRFSSILNVIRRCYKQMIDLGIPKEDARYILPNACETTLVMTMNLRELMSFCNERLCSRAQWEIRCLANKIRESVVEIMPEAATMLVPKCERDNAHPFCTEANSCGMHKKLEEVYGK
jgi:thymidylate synthase (FAD)